MYIQCTVLYKKCTVELLIHRIPSLRMRQLKQKKLFSRQTFAPPFKRNPTLW